LLFFQLALTSPSFLAQHLELVFDYVSFEA